MALFHKLSGLFQLDLQIMLSCVRAKVHLHFEQCLGLAQIGMQEALSTIQTEAALYVQQLVGDIALRCNTCK